MKLVVNGANAYCYTAGKEIVRGGDAIVFIHGAGMDHSVWTMVARHFARKGRQVISVDLPGHGRSAGNARTSIEAMADWITALLTALGIEQASLVGHSMGGLVALDYAARFPAQARSLALVASTAPMKVSPAILEAALVNDHAAFDMLTQWGYSKAHQFGGNSNPGMWMIGSTLRLFERSRPGVLHADMNACNSYAQGIARAGAVRCPTLMVLGQEDRLTPVAGTLPLQRALQQPFIEVLNGAGHTLMVEAPNQLLDALRRVL